MTLDDELDEGRTMQMDEAQLRWLLRLSATGNEDLDIDVSDLDANDGVPLVIEDTQTAPAPAAYHETSKASRAVHSE